MKFFIIYFLKCWSKSETSSYVFMLRMNIRCLVKHCGAYKNRIYITTRGGKTTADTRHTGHSFSRLSPCPVRSSFL